MAFTLCLRHILPRVEWTNFGPFLKLAHSPFSFFHGHPTPCRPRSSVAGTYSGVGFVSSYPGRVVSNTWPPEIFETSRVQVASFLVADCWILGGVCYGFATDTHRSFPLIDAVVDRVLAQPTGPRFVAGDLNLLLRKVPQLARLHSHGFAEIQDIRAARQGILPENTCKNSSRKDFLFVSPELQEMFMGCRIDPTFSADHSLVSATFRLSRSHIPRFIWRTPRPRTALPQGSLHGVASGPGPNPPCPTEAFSSICQEYESAWSAAEQAAKCVRAEIAAVRRARAGDVEPAYFGANRQHALWFRQLSRLQAVYQAQKKCLNPATGQHQSIARLDHLAGLWSSVLRAPGFGRSFQEWWLLREVTLAGDLERIPQACPGPQQSMQVFLAFQANFQAFERKLLGHRKAQAQQRRQQDPCLIFRDIRSPPKAPVETLLDKKVAHIIEVDIEDQALVLDCDKPWDAAVPFTINGVPVHAVHVETDKVWVSSLDGVDPEFPLEQKRVIGSLLEIFSEFGKQWGARWMKHEGHDVTRWQQLTSSFQDHIRVPTMQLQPISLELWKQTLRAKKPTCAAGPDGLSRADLLAFPDSLTVRILDLCHTAETSGQWPTQVLQSIVTSLEKVPGAAAVSEYRPICVLSLVYRVWSSIRAREALRHLQQHVPPGLLGNVPGFCSADAWFSIQLRIEEALRTGSHLCGLSDEDLIKAFNASPRVPVMAYAKCCGLPDRLVTPWMSMLTQLRRRFRVRGSVGPSILSSTGFAEGDALSCVAMTLVNIGFHHAVSCAAVGPSQAISYVDNWETVSSTVPALLSAHAATKEFTQAWDLPIDVTKTRAWSTSAEGRASLRAQGFQESLGFRDLGAHLQTPRCRRNATQVARIKARDDKWPRLKASLAPRQQKVRASSVAAWPAALHAVSAVSLGECHFKSLRSSAMQAIGLKAPGASPFLQLPLVEHPVADPFFFALRSSFFDVCALAGESLVAPLLDLAVSQDTQSPGPGFFDAFGPLEVWSLSAPELQLCLVFAWQQAVQDRLSHRPSFSGLQDADPHTTRLLLKTFQPQEQSFLQLSLNGTFFTNDSLQYAGSDCDPTCPFCGVRDSLGHRILDCPHFADCRQSCGLSEATLRGLPEAQVLHAWVPRCPEWIEIQRALIMLPCSFDDFGPFPELPEYDVFTDGSCISPSTPALRLSSWACSIAFPGFPIRSLRVSKGLVPGLLQSAFRGEVCAIVSAAFFCWRTRRPVRVWSDCLGAIRRARALLWKAPGRLAPAASTRISGACSLSS